MEGYYTYAFRLQRLIMTYLGVWPKENIWYNTYQIFLIVVQNIVLMACCLTILDDSTDVSHAAFFICVGITVVAYDVKVFILNKKKTTLNKILEDLKQPMFKPNEEQHEKFMKKTVALMINVRKLLHAPVVFFIILTGVLPTLEDVKRPLTFNLPFNVDNLPYTLYLFIYFMQLFCTFICAFNNSSIDTTICSFIALGSTQVKILRDNLNCVTNLITETDLDSNNGTIMEKLKMCIQHHVKIIIYIQNLEEMFSLPFLVQFICSVITIGITGFAFFITPIRDGLFTILASYFAAAFVEIAIFCLFGDELIINSLYIPKACYFSKWDHCGPEMRKLLFIIMEYSKQPMVLTAGKFAVLSRRSLLMLCKTSYSYLALLRKVYGGD